MFVKLAMIACSMSIALAAWHGPLAGGRPADLYPAGVSPSACPNYPHCANPAVAVQATAATWNAGAQGGWNAGAQGGAWNNGWNGAGAGGAGHWGDNGGWDNGGWNNNAGWNNNGLDGSDYTGDGDYRGEGLAESGAYGDVSQNYNDNGAWNNQGWNAAPAPAYGHAAQVPAGVDPHACPNYPFCH